MPVQQKYDKTYCTIPTIVALVAQTHIMKTAGVPWHLPLMLLPDKTNSRKRNGSCVTERLVNQV